MLKGFIIFVYQWLKLVAQSTYFLFKERPSNFIRSLLLILIGLPLLLVLQLINWLGFLLDEILFRNYRKVLVTKPLFILGVPRSGTTFLQRTLAKDTQLTTTELWECVFAPSISQRYFWHYFSRVLKPFKFLISKIGSRIGNKMDAIHTLGLKEAEEDFLLLLPILHSFIQMVLFPSLPMNWKLAFIDRDFSEQERQLVLKFYHRMVQKHLYFHGQEKIYLTKNPSFTSLLQGLIEFYPDAQFIACVRSPENTVPSQFASLKPAFDALGHDLNAPVFEKRIIEMLSYYYQHINEAASQHSQCNVVTMDELKQQLMESIEAIYSSCSWTMSAELRNHYQQLSEKNKNFKSGHQYSKKEALAGDYQDSFSGLWPLSDELSLLGRKSSKVI